MYDQQRFVSLTLPVALGELIDNSITSYERLPDPREKCAVHIHLGRTSENSIEIRDNGFGIRKTDLPRLFRMGNRSPDDVGLGRHGMGLKVAAFWWGKKLTITSTALGEPVLRTMEVDLSSPSTRVPTCREVAHNESDHFTHVIVDCAYPDRTLPRTLQKSELLTALGSIYEEYINDGYRITVDDKALEYEPTPCLVEPFWPNDAGPGSDEKREWKKYLEFTVGTRSVTGWIGQREHGSTSLAGIVLLWNRKAIRGSAATPSYRPKALYPGGNSFADQRLFGRFDIGAFDKSLTTDGISWSLDDENEFAEKILTAITAQDFPLLEMIGNYRPKLAKRRAAEEEGPFPHKNTVSDLESLGRQIRDLTGLPAPQGSSDDHLPKSIFQIDGERQVVLEDLVRTTADVEIPYRLVLQHLGQETRWCSTVKLEDSSVEVLINVDHPFHRRYGFPPRHDEAPLLRIALAIGMSRLFYDLDVSSIEHFLLIE